MSRGSVIIDEGAERALVEDGASLLPVGVIGSTGDFSEGDVVSVFSRAGSLIGKGITRYSSDEIRRAMGLKLDVLSRFMPLKAEQPCIHRDELLLF
jgi:glutamate 5-kinase